MKSQHTTKFRSETRSFAIRRMLEHNKVRVEIRKLEPMHFNVRYISASLAASLLRSLRRHNDFWKISLPVETFNLNAYTAEIETNYQNSL